MRVNNEIEYIPAMRHLVGDLPALATPTRSVIVNQSGVSAARQHFGSAPIPPDLYGNQARLSQMKTGHINLMQLHLVVHLTKIKIYVRARDQALYF